MTLTAIGVPLGARPVLRERLTARIAALGGTLTTEGPGPVGLRLPFAPVAEHGEEKRER
ncbi:hypothetical protein [Streptomyces sp. DSM 15324]|uniref:hypothetical protein n=1 Tax=Streptomyces sp. DSM 15324 TaxID=1739111 RepID=UPI000AD57D12|nr:hypothetical protein [Streptomyces sp. DSM 15324]